MQRHIQELLISFQAVLPGGCCSLQQRFIYRLLFLPSFMCTSLFNLTDWRQMCPTFPPVVPLTGSMWGEWIKARSSGFLNTAHYVVRHRESLPAPDFSEYFNLRFGCRQHASSVPNSFILSSLSHAALVAMSRFFFLPASTSSPVTTTAPICRFSLCPALRPSLRPRRTRRPRLSALLHTSTHTHKRWSWQPSSCLAPGSTVCVSDIPVCTVAGLFDCLQVHFLSSINCLCLQSSFPDKAGLQRTCAVCVCVHSCVWLDNLLQLLKHAQISSGLHRAAPGGQSQLP